MWNQSDSFNNTDYRDGYMLFLPECILIPIELVVTLAAIFATCSLVKKDQAAPVYIINLLISDLMQLGSRIVVLTKWDDFAIGISRLLGQVSLCICFIGIVASIGFMVCISIERYFAIAWPLWYRFKRNVKTTVVVCVVVWTLPIPLFVTLIAFPHICVFILGVLLVLPIPLFIFCLAGTIRALSGTISVPVDEKRRIVSILVLVLLVYTLLFLPSILFILVEEVRDDENFGYLFMITLLISPLADSTLSLLLKKGAIDKVLASLCHKMTNNPQTNFMNNDTTSTTCTQTV